jgi:hypothetical protein
MEKNFVDWKRIGIFIAFAFGIACATSGRTGSDLQRSTICGSLRPGIDPRCADRNHTRRAPRYRDCQPGSGESKISGILR